MFEIDEDAKDEVSADERSRITQDSSTVFRAQHPIIAEARVALCNGCRVTPAGSDRWRANPTDVHVL